MADQSLLARAGLDPAIARSVLADALTGADDGELFLEYRQSESLVFDNGRLKQAGTDNAQGFGLRSVKGEAVGYAHSSDVSEAALKRAAETVRAVAGGYSGTLAAGPVRSNVRLYADDNPLAAPAFGDKVKLLRPSTPMRGRRIRRCGRSRPRSPPPGRWSRSSGPTASFSATSAPGPPQRLHRRRLRRPPGGGQPRLWRTRRLCRVHHRGPLAPCGRRGLRQALVNLESIPSPAGEMDVVLGPGWPGVMLHEAVGHGLEGDFNRKGQSAFAGLMGEMVAAPGVTVVDDGTIADRRGSISIDDEGTASHRTVLIENGRLVGYMQDRQNARLMGVAATGNGRRESYAHVPMPRMTNTYMLAGSHTRDEIIASVTNGLYAVSFGGGQVDITSGKYVFECTEAYRIENGKVGAPVKGAMLIGSGPADMKRVTMVGNDMSLDTGIGTCGKAGQWVPVGVGQPTLKMERITVGGTG